VDPFSNAELQKKYGDFDIMPRKFVGLGTLPPATAYVFSAGCPDAVLYNANQAKYHLGELVQICDGVDDQVQINAAIIAAAATNGEVILSGGTFYISAPIYIYTTQYHSVVLRGQGIKGTYIYLVDGSNCNMVEMDPVVAYDCEYFTIRDMQFGGNYANNTSGNCINLATNGLYEPHNFTMENVTLGSSRDECFKATAVNLIRLYNIVMSGATSNHVFSVNSCDGTLSVNLVLLRYGGLTDNMAFNAAAAQPDVIVDDGTQFTVGESVRIYDDLAGETNSILGIVGNTLTMTNNLANNYTTANNGRVREIHDCMVFNGGSESNFTNTLLDGSYMAHALVTSNTSRLKFQNFYIGAFWKNAIYTSGSGDSIIFNTGSILGHGEITGGYYGLYINADSGIYTNITLERGTGTGAMRGVYLAAGAANNIINNVSVEEVDTPALYGLVDNSDEFNIISDFIGILIPGEKRVARIALTGAAQNVIDFAWQNPHGNAILIDKVIVDATTPSTLAASMDIGFDADGTGAGTDFFDDVPIDAAGTYDSTIAAHQGQQVAGSLKMPANGGANDWITGMIRDASGVDLAGFVYIYYTGI